jgi:hypothetical protein
VKHTDDDNLLRLENVEYAIGEPTEKRSTDGTEHGRVSCGVARDSREAGIKRPAKLGDQIRVLLSIPSADLAHVVLGCRTKAKRHLSFSNDSRTSSHVRPASGLAR